MRVFISVGEASGDMHAAAVVRALKERVAGIGIHGVAGPAMVAAGCNPLYPMSELNVMGIGDVVRAWPRIRRLEQDVLSWAAAERPDAAVLVDFPGFHMRLGTKLRRLGIPVIQYIAPKLWAWGAWRAKRLRAAQDALACIFPFEPEWFGHRGIAGRYVGNPSAYACRDGWDASGLRQRLGLPAGTPLVGLLPGSRPGELQRHVSVLAAAWRRMMVQRPDVHAVVPVLPDTDMALLAPLLQAERVHRIERSSEGYALRVDAAVAVSGTATLELALWNVPSILVYRGAPLMMALARRLVHLPHAGLANILLGEEAMPELIQEQCTEQAIAGRLLDLLDASGEAVMRQRQQFARLQAMLGDQNPAAGVVDIVAALASAPGVAGERFP
ncbi:MAG TPA: lipid-A-disaccharide synthase [Mariprofundaceae bacterium]|nr:lipid-A-disaccharide synthase [Mariprofundaceae bacterium]